MTNPYDVVYPVNEILLETFGVGPPGPTGLTGATGVTGPTGATGAKGTADHFVNVKDYGALGNNVANDTTAIQNAYTAAVSAGIKALFFPPGVYVVQPDVHGVILTVTATDFTFFGAGQTASALRVKNNAGNYLAVISDGVFSGSGYADMSGFQFHDMCIDANAANNPISDVTLGGPLFNGFPRMAIRCYKGYYGSIYNARFLNFNGVNTIAVNGGASITGVWSFHNNVFDGTGFGTTHDHSTIYFHGDNVYVSENTFFGAGDAAITAIETHGPNQIVTNNLARDYFTLANITGVSAFNSYSCTVSHNIGQRLGTGINLWAWDFAGLTGYALDSLIVSENCIEIDYDRWNFVSAYRLGISLYPTSTALCRNVKISNNIIRYSPHTDTPVANDNFSAGIGWFRAATVTEGTEEVDIEICDNTITGSLGVGIHYEPNILSKRIKINGNSIVNPGDGCPSPAFALGLKLNVLALGIRDVDISNNRVVDTRAPHLITKGFDFSGTSVVVSGRAIENTVRCNDGVVIQTHSVHASATWNLASSAGAAHQKYAAGRYYCQPAGARTTLAMIQSTLYLSKFVVGVSNTFDRIGANVTVTSGATSLRFGIWYGTGTDLPGDLLYDVGTTPAFTTGFKEISINQSMSAGTYWLGVVPQGGTATISALNVGLYSVGHGTAASLVTSDYSGIISSATFTGALSSAPPLVNYAAFGPLVLLRSS